jgi:hypothetical protein
MWIYRHYYFCIFTIVTTKFVCIFTSKIETAVGSKLSTNKTTHSYWLPENVLVIANENCGRGYSNTTLPLFHLIQF